jgi:hypothetical protein
MAGREEARGHLGGLARFLERLKPARQSLREDKGIRIEDLE